jgi:Mismatch repair ATPase (MutS family)
MVEMTETAHILHHATDRSLVILDEIGRGTSTFDGIAIAWSVAEYLLSTAGRRPKTLFATHYFELTALEKRADCVKNYHVAVAETASGIRFLHRVAPGPANKSYGIHVAKLAGLPAEVIERACEIQASLETTGHPSLDTPTLPQKKKPLLECQLLTNFSYFRWRLFECQLFKKKC